VADELLRTADSAKSSTESLGDGAVLLRGYAVNQAAVCAQLVEAIATRAPFRFMTTPGGFRMSVAMTNCGEVGWVTDRTGYRYDSIDPATDKTWPPMPNALALLATNAAAAAGYRRFKPDSCLINRYEPRARLSLHQDKDERDFSAPIVSLALGLPADAVFHSGTFYVGEQRFIYTALRPMGAGEQFVRFRVRQLGLTQEAQRDVLPIFENGSRVRAGHRDVHVVIVPDVDERPRL